MALALLLTAAPAVGLAASSSADEGEEITLGYQLAWGHMALAEAEVSFHQSDRRYHLTGRGWSDGILAFFVDWRGEAQTEGILQAKERRPLLHRHQGSWDEKTRHTRVSWTPDAARGEGLPETEATPPPDLEQVTEVPPESTRGTTDPFTLALQVLDQVMANGRCEAEAKVWDGRRRYDLKVIHLGEEDLVADRPWAYEGPAIACTLEHDPIGGFWRQPPEWREEAEAGEVLPPERKLWAAEIAPGRWALVRAELQTSYGTVVARLLPEGGLGE